jgi:protein-L-isoaspartate(D-aspartate) O-methyltransferase
VHLEEAFRNINRKNFLPENEADNAEVDIPLPIGFGQTNSQPSTVKMMLMWLDVQAGEKVLDVGSGSGWTSALLAYLVGQYGRVHAVEIIPDLVEFGRENCKRLNILNVDFHSASQEFGLNKHSPYDRILVSAATDAVPKTLIDQLRKFGKLVMPVNNDVLEITKTDQNKTETIAHPGFAFVPLVSNTG